MQAAGGSGAMGLHRGDEFPGLVHAEIEAPGRAFAEQSVERGVGDQLDADVGLPHADQPAFASRAASIRAVTS